MFIHFPSQTQFFNFSIESMEILEGVFHFGGSKPQNQREKGFNRKPETE